jgi:hypothetical protein
MGAVSGHRQLSGHGAATNPRHDAFGAGAVYERLVDSGGGSVEFSGIIRCLRWP